MSRSVPPLSAPGDGSLGPCARRRRQAGVSMIEMVLALSVLLIAVLGHTASAWTSQRLSRVEAARSARLAAVAQFVERLRADEDWTGLWERLRIRKQMASANTSQASEDYVRLDDGRRAWHVGAYYSDFADAPDVDQLAVLVDVPVSMGVGGTFVLREDLTDVTYGLPADLDGDGSVEPGDRKDDYMALPIVLHFRYTVPGEPPQQLRMETWLGEVR